MYAEIGRMYEVNVGLYLCQVSGVIRLLDPQVGLVRGRCFLFDQVVCVDLGSDVVDHLLRR